MNILKHLALALSFITVALATPNAKQPALLPTPQSIEWGDNAITLKSLRIDYPAAEIKKDKLKGTQLLAEIKELLKSNRITYAKDASSTLQLKLTEVEAPYQKDEAYKLSVSQKKILIEANTINGLYYGIQTLRQLIVSSPEKTTIAACTIHDYPAYKIRGYMHDVGRNFQSLELLKRHADVLAAYKHNVFHWHLTDHFGWRLESKLYPGLQAKSSFGRFVGKYYTQQEFVDFIDYCWARNITVIPEFDSPGHSEAFRHGVGVKNMKDPKAKKAMVDLINEICALVPKERMPYIHLGTDEVRHAEEYVNADYLPALHDAVHANGREVIGWWKGMRVPGDTKQIQQTWAQSNPAGGMRHIDSRANYVNHLDPLDCAIRLLFQQACRQPHSDDIQLGGILCYWPDILISDENTGMRISPVYLSMVAYSETVWTGIKQDRPEFWACRPPAGTPEFDALADFERRLAEHRDRFLSNTPFYFVQTAHIPWRLLGPVSSKELKGLESKKIEDSFTDRGNTYSWTNEPVYGGTTHIKHFFGFKSVLNSFPQGKDTVYAFTFIHSPEDQTLDAWINFNTISASDIRAGSSVNGQWNPNKLCNVWINGNRVNPPKWKNPRGIKNIECPISDEVYTNREPSKITLKKGWNKVLIQTASSWKWSFTFTPILWDGKIAREVPGLKYSTDLNEVSQK